MPDKATICHSHEKHPTIPHLISYTPPTLRPTHHPMAKKLGGSGLDVGCEIHEISDGYIACGYMGSNNGDVTGYHGFSRSIQKPWKYFLTRHSRQYPCVLLKALPCKFAFWIFRAGKCFAKVVMVNWIFQCCARGFTLLWHVVKAEKCFQGSL